MSVNQNGLEAALEAFLGGKDFKAGVILCTRARRQKTSYVVELMPEGRYRVLLEAQVGDKNKEPAHAFLDLPTLDDKDLSLWRGNEDSYFNSDFAAKEQGLIRQLRGQFQNYLDSHFKALTTKPKKLKPV